MKILTIADFSHRLRVHFHARTPDSGPNDAGAATLQDLSDWRRTSEHLIVSCDAPPYLRTQQFPEYKQGRARDEAYIQICRWTRDRLIKDGYSIAFSDGHEADDCVSTLALALSDRFDEIKIISEDKDMLSCLTDKVKMYAPKQRGEFEVRDAEWLREKWGIAPEQVALFLAITGDKADAVPGCKGIGEKGAAKLINEFGTIAKMRVAAVAALEESQKEGAKPLAAFWRNFLAGSPNLPEYLKLTTLRTDVPLDIDSLLVKRQPAPLVVDTMGEELSDSWEGPSREELEEERAMLDPATIISPAPEAKTELPKQQALPPSVSPPTPTRTESPVASSPTPLPVTAPSGTPAQTPSMKPPRALDEITSIVVDRPPAPSWALQLQPASVREADILSKALWNSRHYMTLEHAPALLSIILKGRELGIGAMAALEMFFLVKGRPFPSAKGKHYLALRDPNCVWFTVTSADDKHATVKTKHREAGILEYTYTIERAQRAGYLTGSNKHNWAAMTQEMLEARAKSKGADRWYPGSTFGMPSAEEVQDREEGVNDDE